MNARQSRKIAKRWAINYYGKGKKLDISYINALAGKHNTTWLVNVKKMGAKLDVFADLNEFQIG